MPRMRAIDAAVAILQAEGVTNVFGLPGAAINPFYSALKNNGTNTPLKVASSAPFGIPCVY